MTVWWLRPWKWCTFKVAVQRHHISNEPFLKRERQREKKKGGVIRWNKRKIFTSPVVFWADTAALFWRDLAGHFYLLLFSMKHVKEVHRVSWKPSSPQTIYIQGNRLFLTGAWQTEIDCDHATSGSDALSFARFLLLRHTTTIRPLGSFFRLLSIVANSGVLVDHARFCGETTNLLLSDPSVITRPWKSRNQFPRLLIFLMVCLFY